MLNKNFLLVPICNPDPCGNRAHSQPSKRELYSFENRTDPKAATTRPLEIFYTSGCPYADAAIRPLPNWTADPTALATGLAFLFVLYSSENSRSLF